MGLRARAVYEMDAGVGLESVYVDVSGGKAGAHSTKTGRKICAKGCSQKFNADFIEAYFDDEDKPRFNAWLEKDLLADISLEKKFDEQYGPKNQIDRYKAPTEG